MMAAQIQSACFLVIACLLLSSAADPVTDTKMQASELEVLRGDIAALKPRVSAGGFTTLPFAQAWCDVVSVHTGLCRGPHCAVSLFGRLMLRRGWFNV